MGEARSSIRSWIEALAGPVRIRVTTGAVVVVAVTLLVGAVALVTVVRESLVNDRRDVAETVADDVAASLAITGDVARVSLPNVDDQAIQILGPDGRVLASTSNVAGREALASVRPGESSESHLQIADDSGFVIVAVAAGRPESPLTVIAARWIGDVAESTDILTRLLGIGLPALLAIVGLTTWIVVGRALAPVEAIRREADGISARQLERRLPEPASHDEVARLAATMNRMLGRLEAAQSRQHQFVSDASHELRSPVASIRQHTEVALAYPESTTITDLATIVLAADLRLQGIVEDLLLLSRLDEGGVLGHAQAVDLDDLVFDEARRLRETTALHVDSTRVSAGRVLGDPAPLRRMIRNLADNAARHATLGVTFSLVDVAGEGVILRVDDDGPGIDVDDRIRVFERFVRLDGARARDHGGSGLGLAIVADVAALHCGTAVATAAPDGGARLEVRLPSLDD